MVVVAVVSPKPSVLSRARGVATRGANRGWLWVAAACPMFAGPGEAGRLHHAPLRLVCVGLSGCRFYRIWESRRGEETNEGGLCA